MVLENLHQIWILRQEMQNFHQYLKQEKEVEQNKFYLPLQYALQHSGHTQKAYQYLFYDQNILRQSWLNILGYYHDVPYLDKTYMVKSSDKSSIVWNEQGKQQA